MQIIGKAVVLLAVLGGALMNESVEAKGVEMSSKSECTSFWQEVVSPDKRLTVNQQRELWEKYKARCEATGVYDFGMAKIYVQGHQYDEARAAANRAVKSTDPVVREEAEILIVESYFIELTNKKDDLSEKEWQEIKTRYEGFIKKYPNSYGGYNGLAAVALARKDYPNAIKWSMVANEKYPTAKAYRKLVIAYAQVDQYKEAIAAGTKAVEADRKLLADREMMLALALSHIELGQYESAKRTLETLLSYNPQMKGDKGFMNISGYLRQQMQKAATTK